MATKSNYTGPYARRYDHLGPNRPHPPTHIHHTPSLPSLPPPHTRLPPKHIHPPTTYDPSRALPTAGQRPFARTRTL